MSVGMVQVAFVAAALFCAGIFSASYPRSLLGGLAGVPLMLGGAAVLFAGASRFAASRADAATGQEFAAVLALSALAFVLVGRAWVGPGEERR